MNNLEICQRIAEIQEVNLNKVQNEYNPIENDALCFELMVIYAIKVSPRIGNTSATWTGGTIEASGEKHTNRAICLAIIDAFKP